MLKGGKGRASIYCLFLLFNCSSLLKFFSYLKLLQGASDLICSCSLIFLSIPPSLNSPHTILFSLVSHQSAALHTILPLLQNFPDIPILIIASPYINQPSENGKDDCHPRCRLSRYPSHSQVNTHPKVCV